MSDPFAKEKLYEALDFFSRNVKYAGKVKLFKLLYYFDLMMFRRTGKTVTGLRYNAWPMGPVPEALNKDFDDIGSEFRQRFDVKQFKRVESEFSVTIDTDEFELESHRRETSYIPGSIQARTSREPRFLTRREMGIAKLIAEVFYEATAEQMSDISHNKLGPWRKAIVRGKQQGVERPPVDLMEGVVAVGNAAEELPPDELRELVEERERLHQTLG